MAGQDNQDQQDYQDYQDYLEYQKHISSGVMDNINQGVKQFKDFNPSNKQMIQAAKHPATGMDDPAYQAVGMTSEAPIWALLKGVPKAVSGVRNFLKPAAQRAEVLDKVKNIGELEPYVQGKVQEANQMFNKNQIGSRMLEQESRLKGSTLKINPDELKGLTPELDAYAESLKVAKPDNTGIDLYGRSGKGQPTQPNFSDVEIPAEEGLKIRKMLNDASGWKSHPLDPTRAQAVDSQAAALHQKLSGQMQSIDPAMAPLSEEMQQSYNLQKNTMGRGTNPVGKLTSKTPTQQSRLAQFDQGAGSNLQGLGQDINTASDRLKPMDLSDLFSLKSPKVVAKKAGDIAGRGYDAMAQKMTPTLEDLLKNPSAIKNLGPNEIGRILSVGQDEK